MKTFLVTLLLLVASTSWADSDKEGNCRLTIRTTKQDGHRTIDVISVDAINQLDCKAQAEDKRKELLKNHDADVKEIVISSGWGGPS